MPLIRAKPRDCNANIIWKVQTVWENKMGLKEHKMSSSVGWKIEINSNYWLLKVIMSYALLCLCDMKMSKFYPKWSLCLSGNFLCWRHFCFSTRVELSTWTLYELLDSHWTYPADSRLHDMDHLWSETVCCLTSSLLGLLLGSVWFVLPTLWCLGSPLGLVCLDL